MRAMSGRLAGKRALITGAASGMGRAAALRFAEEGAQVALLDVDAPGLDSTLAEMGSVNDGVAYVVDVSKENEVEEATTDFASRAGGLDVVVANAAVDLIGEDDRVDRLDLSVWQRTIEVNLTGTFLTCKHGIRQLLRSGGGAVICTASPTGLYGGSPGADAYSASKGGIFALVRVMAADYAAENIRINAVVPGFTDTPMVDRFISDSSARERIVRTIPMGRPGTADEVAAMMCFLASEEASYATGGYFVVDGGMTAI
jgi:NAD(P)-dependent dehydrogenase (short-subunit alcohol dehydrogenase family)